MLSIIISSYQPEYFSVLEENIAQTCGIAYEIIKVDNHGIMGICKAYNQGAEKAQYENLLFLHEDVYFETQNWGIVLEAYMMRKEIGVVGTAGTNYIPNVPFAWWDSFENEFRNIIQYNGQEKIRDYKINEDKSVFALDGVFLACRNNVYNNYLFNEKLQGFHAYDIDFSTRISNDYQNIVSSRIKIRHFSQGKPDKIWFENMIKARNLFTSPSSQKDDKKKEVFYFQKFQKHLQDFKFSKRETVRLLWKYNQYTKIGYKRYFQNYRTILSVIFS